MSTVFFFEAEKALVAGERMAAGPKGEMDDATRAGWWAP
jgi:hypothetical protein